LTGLKIDSLKEMERAAMKIRALGAKVVIVKGGHLKSDAVDVVYDGRAVTYLRARRIATKNTHGTGCTFSAAIAAGLARDMPPLDAARQAKRFVTQAIRHSLNVGKGPGPLGHGYRWWNRSR
jgi:hydroxymethylpyrimidine/phosphomethylpyrimidine kinase